MLVGQIRPLLALELIPLPHRFLPQDKEFFADLFQRDSADLFQSTLLQSLDFHKSISDTYRIEEYACDYLRVIERLDKTLQEKKFAPLSVPTMFLDPLPTSNTKSTMKKKRRIAIYWKGSGQTKKNLIMPHTCSHWVLTYSTSRWFQHHFFQDLSTIFHARLLHTMAFNSYSAIERRISKACDTIHDGWYTNCVQAASAYEVSFRRL